MAPVNADNPKPRAAPPAGAAPPPSDGSLEDRIDSLLSEMQESLDEFDRPSDGDDDNASHAQQRTDPAEDEAKPTPQDEALAAALDEAVAQAEQALDSDDAPANDASADDAPADGAPSAKAPMVLDPEMDIEPAENADIEEQEPASEDDLDDAAPLPTPPAPAAIHQSAPSVSAAQAPESIDTLDEQLARQAASLSEEPEPVIDRGASAQDAAPAPDIIERAARSPEPASAPAGTKPAPTSTAAATGTPAPEGAAKPSKLQIKGKIAVRKREGAESPDAPAADQGEVSAPAPDSATPVLGANAASKARAAATSNALPARALGFMAGPLKFVPPHVRDYLGWFGLLTAFNAACVWIFWMLLRA